MGFLDQARNCCDEVLQASDLEPLHDAARTARAKLDGPLHVAVAGWMKAGKSTLINALVGRTVAATGAAETTRVNCWFRHASKLGREAAFVHRPGAAAPEEVAVDEVVGVTDVDSRLVEPVTVYLDHELLEDLVVIDSPGLGSPRRYDARALEMLGDPAALERAAEVEGEEDEDAALDRRTSQAVNAADAVLYLSSEVPGRAVEQQQLERFASLFGGVKRAPVNSLMLLSAVDRRWDREQARETPFELAARLLWSDPERGQAIRSVVWDAVPVLGLLAETARCGGVAIDERMIADLRALAAYPQREVMVVTDEMLARVHVPGVPGERRVALRHALDWYGLIFAMDRVAAGTSDPSELRAQLEEASGIAEVERLLRGVFADRSPTLRSDAALATLEKLARRREGGISVRAANRVLAATETVRAAPGADVLRDLDALRRCTDDSIRLPDDRRRELRLLFGGRDAFERLGAADGEDPGALADRARSRHRHWKEIANARGDPRRGSLAAEAARAYERARRELEGARA